jgi:hypothetical protein
MLAAMLAVGLGCNDERPNPIQDAAPDIPSGGDADREIEGDGAANDAAEPDAEQDSDLAPVPGPLTFILNDVEALAERLCDLDGDGDLDNAIADLGSPNAEMLALALTSGFRGAIEDGSRVAAHLPLVGDVTVPHDPDVTVIVFPAEDVDEPDDPDDDFSGEEAFAIPALAMDSCGEPTAYFQHAAIDRGAFRGDSGSFIAATVDWQLVLRSASLWGSIAPFGASLELQGCGACLVAELGASPGVARTGELSMLETLLAGGAAMGMPSLPGVSPDVDLDGDGLERFVLDAAGRLQRCIDGDSTPIEGAECWRDPRIADGFGVSVRFVASPAVFAGRDPGWDADAAPCDAAPETSLLDPR